MSVKSKIQALIASSNSVTGESDTDLTGAMQTLCDGYHIGSVSTDDYNALKSIIERSAATVVIPEGITTIGNNIFNYDNILKDVTIPSTCAYIKNTAFMYAYNVEKIRFPEVVRENGSVVNRIEIGTYAFSQFAYGAPVNADVNTMQIPDNLIPSASATMCFSGSYKLTFHHVPQLWDRIPASCFSGCLGFTHFTLHNGIETVGKAAFNGCTNLAEVTFEGTPDTVAATAFNGCTALTDIRVPWAEGAVAGAPWGAVNATITYNYSGGDA